MYSSLSLPFYIKNTRSFFKFNFIPMGSSLALAGVGYRAVQPLTAQSPLRGGVLAGEQSAIVLKSLSDLARYI